MVKKADSVSRDAMLDEGRRAMLDKGCRRYC